MYKTILLVIFIVTTVFAKEYKDIYPKLKSIETEGIILGSGKINVYVFVDPLCPFSRKFITTLFENKQMFQKYHYTIFLYSIPRLHSENVVSAIYQSKTPADTLLDVMLKGKDIEIQESKKTKTTLKNIKETAQYIGVNKRPYIIIEKQ